MHGWQEFWNSMDWWRLLGFALSAAAVLLCMTVHEVSHGYAAYRLGDTTAKSMGRLSLNPLKHVDPIGALLLLFVGVGWAKPVSVDPRHFKNPKGGMALTALAGPVSNLMLTLLLLLLCRLLTPWMPRAGTALLIFYLFLCHVAVLSLGLGIFNLIPIPPLDGSKVLFAVLPEKLYWTIQRYERYILFLVLALSFFGAFDGWLSLALEKILGLFCALTGMDVNTVLYGSYFFSILR